MCKNKINYEQLKLWVKSKEGIDFMKKISSEALQARKELEQRLQVSLADLKRPVNRIR